MNSSNLSIKYSWNPGDKSGIDLKILGESIGGFSRTIKELVRVFRIQGEISIVVQKVEEGSIDFKLIADVVSLVPFERLEHFYEFARFVGSSTATDTFQLVAKAHQNLNDFFAKNPLDMAALGYGIARLVDIARRQKRIPTLIDEQGKSIPKSYAVRLSRLIRKEHGFKKALKPFVEGQVSTIEVGSPFKNFKTYIDSRNFEDFLAEEERIMPNYENGHSYEFEGQIVGLEKSMGEHIRFKMQNLPREYSLLTAYPEIGKTTQDYVDYYAKGVRVRAKILRSSMYQRPKLQVQTIELIQNQLIQSE